MNITKKDMSILIGLLLGDGYINPKGRIGIEHCEKQKDFCIDKAKLLHSICGGKDIVVQENKRIRTPLKNGKEWKSKEFITYSFKKQSAAFIPIRNLLYKNNIKTITKEILEFLDPLSIAIWWLDDGTLTAKYNKGSDKPHYMLRLCTYLSKEENQLIANYFENTYSMKWNVVKADGCKDNSQYMLRCGQTEGIKFLNIIRDIVINKFPSMAYKVLDI